VTSGGRLLHILALETVLRWKHGTVRWLNEADLSTCQQKGRDTMTSLSAGYIVIHLICIIALY